LIFDWFYVGFSITSKRCYEERMKRPFESGLQPIGYRLCLAWPNFVRRRGVETVVFQLFLCNVLYNIKKDVMKKE